MSKTRKKQKKGEHVLVAALVALGLLAAGPAHAGSLALRPYDCTSVQEYVASNAGNVVALAKSLVPLAFSPPPPVDISSLDVGLPALNQWLRPVVSAVAQVFPHVTPQVGAQYLGIGIQVWRAFLSVGGSPVGVLNIPLGLVCRRFEAVTTPTAAPGG